MNGPPAFQFYPADYLADGKVQAMSIEGEGCYIRLLCYCWREGSIPADRSAIALLCKGYNGPGIDEALTCFRPSHKKGRLIQKRLEAERIRQEKFRKSKQEAGLRGAESRWHKHGTAIDLPMAKDGSSSSSSSSSSSAIKDLKHIAPSEASGPCDSDPILHEFSELWNAYPPDKGGKQDALKAFRALRKTVLIEDIIRAYYGYMAYLKDKRLHENFEQRPKHLSTWLRGDRWREYLDYKPRANL